MRRIALTGICSVAIACTPDNADLLRTGRWVDLSHDFSAETIYWPTAKPFALEVVSAQRTPGGYWYAANNFSAAEHGGTHLDAPVHFAEGKWTTDQIPLDRLVGEAVLVDVQSGADSSADYRVDLNALDEWERKHGAIPGGAIVLFRTGWSRRWPDRAKYLGTTRTGEVRWRSSTFPASIPRPPAGWWNAGSARWASIPPASTTASPVLTLRIRYSSPRTFRRSRTLPISTRCR
jgi:hypothetical protein